jgi:hypothetical protein
MSTTPALKNHSNLFWLLHFGILPLVVMEFYIMNTVDVDLLPDDLMGFVFYNSPFIIAIAYSLGWKWISGLDLKHFRSLTLVQKFKAYPIQVTMIWLILSPLLLYYIRSIVWMLTDIDIKL